MAVIYVGGTNKHHLSRRATLPSSARGLLGGGSVHCGPCCLCLGNCPVLAVVEHIYFPLDQKSKKSTQKRTQKSNGAQKSTQKSNEAQKSTQKSKFTKKSTKKSNELKKELKKVKLNGHFTQKSAQKSNEAQKSTQSIFTQKNTNKKE